MLPLIDLSKSYIQAAFAIMSTKKAIYKRLIESKLFNNISKFLAESFNEA